MKRQGRTEVKRVGKFGAVGIANTLIDFGLYNLLTSLGLSYVAANLPSTTVAMTFSYLANQRLVFKSQRRSLAQAALFFIVTAFGLWVIQNGIIHFLTEVWTGPLDLAVDIVRAVGLGEVFSAEFVIKNGAKVTATLASLIWNYLWYKKVVFK